ncbi:MAG: hypothetical protein HYX75_15345 [Acidobacteria bacterium]|nr:hypothetical protein [Acidobacteriota bacterium]
MAKRVELPVTIVETEATPGGEQKVIRVCLKGQRPGDRCLIEFDVDRELIETIHEAKKRNGTVWMQFDVKRKRRLRNGQLVVRDLLE